MQESKAEHLLGWSLVCSLQKVLKMCFIIYNEEMRFVTPGIHLTLVTDNG